MARHGKVNMFGLDEFGTPTGLEPWWGAVAGPGISSGAAVAVRGLSGSYNMKKWSEAVGGLVGALAGGVMMIFETTRGAGTVTLLSSIVSAIPRQTELYLAVSEEEKKPGFVANLLDRAASTSKAKTQTTEGVFGLTTVEPQQLMGPPIANQGPLQQNIAAQQVALMGGPAMTNFAPFYGATSLGGGN